MIHEEIMCIAIAYFTACKLNYGTKTDHIFINIFQTVHFSAENFTRGQWEKFELSFDTKISESLKKNLKQLGWAPLTQKI